MRYRGRHARKRNAAAGFTLVEMLVVLTIFSMVVVSATDIFLLSSRSQRKVFDAERIQADARFALESIVREVRTGAIDYAWYAARGAPPAAPDDALALIDGAGTRVLFKVSDTDDEEHCPDEESRPCLLVSLDGSVPASLTPSRVRVTSGAFYIIPDADPFRFDESEGGYRSDVQPFVTTVLSLEAVNARTDERTDVHVQTTATSRTYAR